MQINVSVIMLVFKESVELVKRSIDSIINQTYTDWELIIAINDITNQPVVNILEEYSSQNPRIILIKNRYNLGCGIARNNAIKIARGTFIAIQDGDDFSRIDRLEKQVTFLEANPSFGAVGSGLVYVDEDFKQLFKRKYQQVVTDDIFVRSPLGHPSMMARKIIFEQNGYYYEKMQEIKGYYFLTEDYDLFLRWYLQGVLLGNIPDYLYVYTKDSLDYFKAKKQIKSALSTKLRYVGKFGFNPKAYFFIILESCLLLIPTSMISKIFYVYRKIKEKY